MDVALIRNIQQSDLKKFCSHIFYFSVLTTSGMLYRLKLPFVQPAVTGARSLDFGFEEYLKALEEFKSVSLVMPLWSGVAFSSK